MSEQPDLSTLPKRMRYAVEVLHEANGRATGSVTVGINISAIRRLADQWEAEDREAAALDDQVETLAQELHHMQRPFHTPGPFASAWEQLSESVRINHRIIARRLINSGWRKADPA